MQLFLDTADVQQIEQRFSSGLIAGVTTTPTLIRRSGSRPSDVYKKLVDIGVEDISMEVVGENSSSLVKNKIEQKTLVTSKDSTGYIELAKGS